MYKNPGRILSHCLILFALCLFSFCKKSNGNNSGIVPPPSQPFPPDTTTYQLVWSDEFDGSTIDTSVWNFEKGGNGWGNNEQEYYQAANAGIEDGNLVITAKKETVGFNNYTS